MLDLVADTPPLDQDAMIPSSRGGIPRVVVFDSGLGGLSVYQEVRRLIPGAALVYAADDAVFPYGGLDEATLVSRVTAVMQVLIDVYRPEAVVIACNTASTLVLGPLRARWPAVAFVGTVPAIKPAAAASASRMISVLATPGTVAREYTRDLVRSFAGDCAVTLVGAPRLAALAEAVIRGEAIDREAIAAQALPAFVQEGARCTDTVVLACTHYPLLLAELEALAPWPVTWIDPSTAIARRAAQVLERAVPPPSAPPPGAGTLAPAFFTSNRMPGEALRSFLASRGLRWERNHALAALSVGEAAR